MKKILVIHYSQSGQLTEILHSIVDKSDLTNCEVEYLDIKPSQSYPFPWTGDSFFEEMPNSVNGRLTELLPMQPKHEKYDLIILGYQVWFLSPSVPVNSFLASDLAKKILVNTPVITVLGVRNMWVVAQENIKKQLKALDAKLVGNIVLEDPNHNMISVLTILHWMMGGKKTKLWGIFPKPGVTEEQIAEAARFGVSINESLQKDDFSNLQTNLIHQKAVKINTNLVFVEGRGSMLFKIWANLIEKKSSSEKKRRRLLRIFKYYLLVAIFIIAPIVLLIYGVIRLFLPITLKKQRLYYQGVSLK
jgi:hypothetical protein